MHTLVLLRHGQTVWNAQNLFTGWTDVPLTERGVQEAHQAGQVLKEKGFIFDEVHSNFLKRCIKTAWIALEELDLMWVPMYLSWRLNERHYGALQGKSKSELAQEYGEEQVLAWRRSYSVSPPPVEENDPRFPGNDPRYRHIETSELPRAESLKDTLDRSLPCYIDDIAPKIMDGKRILVCASGNSLRAIIKHLEDIPDTDEENILNITIPTGIPLVYELDEKLNMKKKYFLADDNKVQAAIEEVKNQGKFIHESH